MMGTALTAAKVAARTTEGGSINAGIWTLVAVVISTFGIIAVAFIKQWGPWKKVNIDARLADFGRLRDDIDKLNARIEKLESLVTTANRDAADAKTHAMKADAKLQTALTACEILLTVVEREMPDASEISLVKRLLAQAASDDMGIGDGMRRIAAMKGTGE